MDEYPVRLTQLIEESMQDNNFEPMRVTDEGDERYSVRWIIQDPNTRLHYTVEVACL